MVRHSQQFQKCRRILGFGGLLSLLCSAALAASHPGLATVTSLDGTPKLQVSDGKFKALDLHQTVSLNQSSLKTERGDQLICLLSNNVALGLSEQSEVAILSFQQETIKPKSVSLNREPSTSLLSMQIVKGTMVLSAQQISPLSQISIELPTGRLSLLSSRTILTVNETSVELTVLDGAVTYETTAVSDRQYLTAPTKVRIALNQSNEAAFRYLNEDSETPEERLSFAQIVEHAHQRVLFTNATLERTEAPKLAVSPEYFKQSSARPYTFQKDPEPTNASSDL